MVHIPALQLTGLARGTHYLGQDKMLRLHESRLVLAYMLEVGSKRKPVVFIST